jgi:chromosome segregation ATPase
MFKKLGFAALILAAGAFVWTQTSAGSYLNTIWERCRNKVAKQVSLEFEVERIRKEIDRIIPDMRKNLGVLAQEMVAVENLREEIASTKVNLAKQKVALKEMRELIQSDVSPVVFNGRAYSADRLRGMLASDLSACQRCEESLKHKENLLEAKERAIDAAKEQLGTIRSQKQELETQLAQLEAEIKTLRVAQARSKIQVDDSKLAQVKGAINDVRNRLRVEVREIELGGQFVSETIIGEQRARTNDEILRDVDQYLNGTTPKNPADRVVDKR